jgi:hypothetical protein
MTLAIRANRCAVILFLLSACGETHAPSASHVEPDASQVAPDSSVQTGQSGDAGAPGAEGALRTLEQGTVDLDLLLVIDNSSLMTKKQAKLDRELPRLFAVLSSGDRCAGLAAGATCPFDDASMTRRHFTPVRSLHVGVVTSNLGGIDGTPASAFASLLSCKGNGDDGKLQSSVEVAVNGVTASRNEFPGFLEGDVVMQADPSCALGNVDRYQDFVAGASGGERAREAARCVARAGVRGCPFEQPLESGWKALAPSSGTGDDYKFLNAETGQGDRYNKGFLRPNAALVVLLLTDEDDCSITEAGKPLFFLPGVPGFEEADRLLGPLNMRCGLAAANATMLHPTERYSRALRSLKSGHPERVVFAAIAGIPPSAALGSKTLDEILASPEMQFRPDPAQGGVIEVRSCTTADGDGAYPPIRIVQTAKAFGSQGLVASVCEDDYRAAVDALVDRAIGALHGSCLPEPLPAGSGGLRSCELYELLPPSETQCVSARGHVGVAVERTLEQGGVPVKRLACQIQQVVAPGTTPPTGAVGWYYDDTSAAVKAECGSGRQQRVALSFSGLPAASELALRCGR